MCFFPCIYISIYIIQTIIFFLPLTVLVKNVIVNEDRRQAAASSRIGAVLHFKCMIWRQSTMYGWQWCEWNGFNDEKYKKEKLDDYFVYMTQNFGSNKRTMKNKRKNTEKRRKKKKKKWATEAKIESMKLLVELKIEATRRIREGKEKKLFFRWWLFLFRNSVYTQVGTLMFIRKFVNAIAPAHFCQHGLLCLSSPERKKKALENYLCH